MVRRGCELIGALCLLLCTAGCALALSEDDPAPAPAANAPSDANAAPSGNSEGGEVSAVEGTGGDGRETIWEAHHRLFMVILIFICVCAFIVVLCVVWLCCRRASKRRHTLDVEGASAGAGPLPLKKEPESPRAAANEPLIAQVNVRPVMAEQPPAQGGSAAPADDENGWIIPMDQLTQEELEQTEPPVSKL